MKRCLIVDDSRVIRRVACRILDDLGFEPREAENGVAALSMVETAMPDAILLDWEMPKMNGLDFVVALRRLPRGGEPKVVFCATENDEQHIRQALEAGADEYIMKPFDGEIVRSKFDILGLLD